MRVLITGGAGYIGSHCNKYLNKVGVDTVVLDNMVFGHEKAVCGGRLVKGDFGDKGLLTNLFSEEKIDAVFHFAAHADVADSVMQPKVYYENNVVKLVSLLDAMVVNDINNIVFSSSASIFGEPDYLPIDENHQKKPINPYGKTKLIGEMILNDYGNAYGINYCSMRYFNASGADKDGDIGESHYPEHHILPLIFKTALKERKQFSVFGNDYNTKDGTCVRDYVHVEDLAVAHYLALKYLIDGNESQCFNLGNNIGFSVLEVINTFEKISGIKLNYEMANRRVGDPAILIASNEKAKSLLGWDPKRSELDNIIKTSWNWENNRKF